VHRGDNVTGEEEKSCGGSSGQWEDQDREQDTEGGSCSGGGGGGVGLGEPGALPCDLSPSGHPGPLSVGSDGDVLPDTGAHADITSRWLKTAAVLALGKGARE
jgi:hypothetical protein